MLTTTKGDMLQLGEAPPKRLTLKKGILWLTWGWMTTMLVCGFVGFDSRMGGPILNVDYFFNQKMPYHVTPEEARGSKPTSPYELGFCNVERRSWISREEFEENYREKKPLILTNVTDLWRGKGAAFSQENLRRTVGSMVIGCGFSAQFPLQGGNGYEKLTIDDYITYLNSPELRQITTHEPLYLFDRGEFFQNAPWFWEEVKVPNSLKHFEDFELDTFFGLGAAMTGVQFHKHNAAFNVIVKGRKLWYLYPPNHMPPFDYMSRTSMKDWVDQKMPLLPDQYKPLQCIHEEGELFYVPEAWYHAVLNLEDTTAVSGQLPHHQLDFSKMESWSEGDEEMMEDVLNMCPTCEELMLALSHIKGENHKPEECVKLAERMLAQNPYHSEAWSTRGVCLASMGYMDGAEYSLDQALKLNPVDKFSARELTKVYKVMEKMDKFYELQKHTDEVYAFTTSYIAQLNAQQDQIKRSLNKGNGYDESESDSMLLLEETEEEINEEEKKRRKGQYVASRRSRNHKKRAKIVPEKEQEKQAEMEIAKNTAQQDGNADKPWKARMGWLKEANEKKKAKQRSLVKNMAERQEKSERLHKKGSDLAVDM